MKYNIIILGLVFLLFFVSCSFNYEEATIQDALDENIPDITLENAKLVFVRGTTIIIESGTVDIYSSQQQQNMFNVKFKEIDRNEGIRMEGRAEQIAIETESNNITMFGNIFARSNQDEAEITTNYLYWDDDSQIMEGSSVFPVTIKKDIGSTIEGYGFLADAKKREITIKGSATGKLVVDEDE